MRGGQSLRSQQEKDTVKDFLNITSQVSNSFSLSKVEEQIKTYFSEIKITYRAVEKRIYSSVSVNNSLPVLKITLKNSLISRFVLMFLLWLVFQ